MSIYTRIGESRIRTRANSPEWSQCSVSQLMIRVCLNCIFAVSVIFTPGAAQTKAASQTGFEATARIFDYDAKQPLDIHDKIIGEFSDGTLHDITYASPKGGPVAAYLVVPKGKGPFAAVLFDMAQVGVLYRLPLFPCHMNQ